MKGDLGLVGCKLCPIYQDIDPLAPAFLAVCDALERLDLPMLIHQGTTFSRAGSLLVARPALLDEIALRYPDLKIVIAHIGHPWFDEAIAVVRRQPNVYADCRRSSAGGGCSTRRSSPRSSTASRTSCSSAPTSRSSRRARRSTACAR